CGAPPHYRSDLRTKTAAEIGPSLNAQRSRPVMCPSAQPEIPGSVAFGVIGGRADDPRVAWIEKPVPVTGDLLALTAPVPPTQVLRIAAPCQEKACCHFDGTA